MATAKGHIITGAIFIYFFIFFITKYFFKPSFTEIILYIVVGILFALWPDVDIKSWGQRIFYSIFLITDIYLIINENFKTAAYLGLIIILPILAKHRGWTHSKISMILIPLPILIYPMIIQHQFTIVNLPYYLAAVTGYFSHLLIDGKL